MTNSEISRAKELVDLIDQYNNCFYSRDIDALREMYVDDGEVIFFDNHSNCDTINLTGHLALVEKYFASGEISELKKENVRVHVSDDYACITLTLRYSTKPRPGVRTTFVCEKELGKWKIRHVHHSTDPNEK